MDRVRVGLLVLLAGLSLGMVGCTSTSSPAPPVIVSQPQDRTVAVGEMALFHVTVEGTGPFTYQWYWNGTTVASAGPYFTTPPVVFGDDQSAFTVKVANVAGQVTSAPASLTVPGAPRRPVAGDLRFRNVGAFPVGIEWNEWTNIVGGMTKLYYSGVGSPMELGCPGPYPGTGDPMNLYYEFFFGAQPAGSPQRLTTYKAGVRARFDADLPAYQSPDTVITCLDFCPAQEAYALEAVRCPGIEPHTRGYGTVALADFPSLASQEAVAGRVITALTVTSSQVTFFSYGWQGDPSGIYEASAVTASAGEVAAAASSLSDQGYIITAFGGNLIDGFCLVGTRVAGDTTPRPLLTSDFPIFQRGYCPVIFAYLYDFATGEGRALHVSQM